MQKTWKMLEHMQHMYRQFHPPYATPPSSPVKTQNRPCNTCTGGSIHLMPFPIFPSEDTEQTTQHIPQGCRNQQLLKKELWLILDGAEIL